MPIVFTVVRAENNWEETMKYHEESLFLSLMKALYKMSIWIWVKNARGLDLMVSSGTLGPEHILSQAMGYNVLCLLSTSPPDAKRHIKSKCADKT